jgi:hypothetical protein
VNPADLRRAQGVIAGAAWLLGLAAFASSIDVAPMAHDGAVVFSPQSPWVCWC